MPTTRSTRHVGIWLGALALAAIPATPALAGNVFCGASNPTHDAPNGYLITSRSQGLIAPVLTTLGEHRTHTMLSHGSSNGSWFTHSTMRIPADSADAPHLNPTQLRFGDPGASQISSAAAYIALYSNGGLDVYKPSTNGGYYDVEGELAFVRKQEGGAEGRSVADFFWHDMSYRWIAPRCGSITTNAYGAYYDCDGNLQPQFLGRKTISVRTGGGYYRLREQVWLPVLGNVLADIPYSLHQYADVGPVNSGTVFASGNEGVVCSTLVSYGVRKALGRTVEPYLYPAQQTADASWSLHQSVKSECLSGIGIFEGALGWLLGYGNKWDICERVASQALNCFLDSSTCASSTRPTVGGQARSISPDTISGWRAGQSWWDQSINGPWTAFWDSYLHFSGGGTTYSCWGNG